MLTNRDVVKCAGTVENGTAQHYCIMFFAFFVLR